VAEDDPRRGGWPRQRDLTGEALRCLRVVGLGVAGPGAQLAKLQGAGRGELVGADQDLDGAAATHALTAAGPAEREADAADGVEEGGPGVVGEDGGVEGDLVAPGAEHDLGHGSSYAAGVEKPKGQLREKLALRTVAGTGFEPMTSGL